MDGTMTDAQSALDDEARCLSRDEGVCFTIAEFIRQGNDVGAARRVAEAWGFHSYKDFASSCHEEFDLEELKKVFK